MFKQGVNLKSISYIFIGLSIVFILITGCQRTDIATISPQETASLFAEKNAIIVDVREDDEWNEQHISGAIHIPLAQVESRLNELAQYKNSPVILQCRSGMRSAKAAAMLMDAGFSKTFSLDGGIVAWDNSGFKTVKPQL